MSDDLERRLEQLGAAPTTPMSVTAVDALEAKLLASRRRQLPWRPLLATAAAVLLLAGAVFAMQRKYNDSLRPATTAATTTVATSATAGSSTTAPSTSTTTTTTVTVMTTVTEPVPTTPGGVPPTNPDTAPATVPGTAPGTAPPTSAPTVPTTAPPPAPTTTQAPVVIPPASFPLTVERVGDRLVFNWPAYTGGDGRQYVLVRVGPAGLNSWPVGPARIATIIARMSVTTTVVNLPGTEQRRWVLAVVGENRTLLAVSTVAISA